MHRLFMAFSCIFLPACLGAAGKPLLTAWGGLTQAWLEAGTTVGRGEGILSMQENPAGLAFSRRMELGASVLWPSGLAAATGNEMVAMSAAFVAPLGSSQGRAALGLQATWLDGGNLSFYDAQGNALGSRKNLWGEFTAAWGVRAGALGLGLSGRLAAPENPDDPITGAVQAAVQARLFPDGRLSLAAVVESPWAGDRTPLPELRFGASFALLPELTVGAETRFVPTEDVEGRFGLHFQPFPALRLGGGLSVRGFAEGDVKLLLGIEVRIARLVFTLTHASIADQSDILAFGIKHAW